MPPLAPAPPGPRQPAGPVVAALALAQALGCATAPAARLPPDCDPANVGVSEEALGRFVEQVETSLARKDWGALAAMTRLPLQVNSAASGGGPVVRFRVADREKLLRRAPDLFASAGERNLSRAAGPARSCRTAQLGMAGGMLWATAIDGGLAITSINCRGCDVAEEREAVELDCVADGRRYVLRLLDGARWLEVSNPSDPAGGIATGRVVEDGEGTGVCAHLVWRAAVGGRRLVVRDAAGCVAEEPEAGTVAFVGEEGAGADVACVASPRRP